MWMWLVILGVTLLVCGGSLIFLISRFYQFESVKKLSGTNKWYRRLFAVLPVSVIVVVLRLIFGTVNMMIIVIVLTLIWIVVEVIARLSHHLRPLTIARRRGPRSGKMPSCGPAEQTSLSHHLRPLTQFLIAATLTIAYFACAWYFAHSVVETDYTLQTDKASQPLKIALIADAHMGTTFDEAGFQNHLQKIAATNPDVIVIAGDLIDDSTTEKEMEACCAALGTLQAPLGVYYSYGNHDKGYSLSSRGYTCEALEEALTKNGVTILEDACADLTDEYVLIGRADASFGSGDPDRAPDEGGISNLGRREIADLLKDIPQDKYTIVLDHEPNDYAAEAAAGADLVLSGHTHGGQLIPINRIGELIGANDRTYGHEKRENTDFIVTSGISAWEIPFKTGCRSEYVIINIEPR